MGVEARGAGAWKLGHPERPLHVGGHCGLPHSFGRLEDVARASHTSASRTGRTRSAAACCYVSALKNSSRRCSVQSATRGERNGQPG